MNPDEIGTFPSKYPVQTSQALPEVRNRQAVPEARLDDVPCAKRGKIPVTAFIAVGDDRDPGLIAKRGDKRVAISEIPYGTTTESLIASIEAAVQKGRVKVAPRALSSSKSFTSTTSAKIPLGPVPTELPMAVELSSIVPSEGLLTTRTENPVSRV